MARRTPLNDVIPFDKNITFHKLVAWSIVFFSWVHTIAHWNNLARFSAGNNLGFMGFILANFATGPGWSGYVMLFSLMAIALTAAEKARRANFERFWYTHHLFIVFFIFWSIHGAFCMIKPDFAPFCDGIGVFWEYWMYGGFAYLAERIAREVRGRHKTYISKVIQHPSNVCEIQIKKEHTTTRAGQVSRYTKNLIECADRTSTSSCAVQRYPSGSIIPSHSPVRLKRTTSRSICVW